MSERERIGKKIAEIRKELGLSTYKVAELSGIKQQNISRVEKGCYSTTLDVLAKIADALGKKIDFLDK